MKIYPKTQKNIRKIQLFSRVRNAVQGQTTQMLYLSGVPPSPGTENQTERAVIMSVFPQFYGTLR